MDGINHQNWEFTAGFPHVRLTGKEYLDMLCPAMWHTDSSGQIKSYTVKRAHTHTKIEKINVYIYI